MLLYGFIYGFMDVAELNVFRNRVVPHCGTHNYGLLCAWNIFTRHYCDLYESQTAKDGYLCALRCNSYLSFRAFAMFYAMLLQCINYNF